MRLLASSQALSVQTSVRAVSSATIASHGSLLIPRGRVHQPIRVISPTLHSPPPPLRRIVGHLESPGRLPSLALQPAWKEGAQRCCVLAVLVAVLVNLGAADLASDPICFSLSSQLRSSPPARPCCPSPRDLPGLAWPGLACRSASSRSLLPLPLLRNCSNLGSNLGLEILDICLFVCLFIVCLFSFSSSSKVTKRFIYLPVTLAPLTRYS